MVKNCVHNIPCYYTWEGLTKKFRQYKELDVVFLMGHSIAAGTAHLSLSTNQEWDATVEQPMNDVWIWDKIATHLANEPEHLDAARNNASHKFRGLTPAYNGLFLYPWETKYDDPLFGLEMQLAADVTKYSNRRLLIVKMAVGGARITLNHNNGPTWNVGETVQRNNLTETFINYYIHAAMRDALDMVGGDQTKINLLGGISIVGGLDIASQGTVDAYAAAMRATIAKVRDAVNPDMHWVVVKEPIIRDGGLVPLPLSTALRLEEDSVGADTNNSIVDTEGMDTIDGLHLVADANNTLGSMVADALRTADASVKLQIRA